MCAEVAVAMYRQYSSTGVDQDKARRKFKVSMKLFALGGVSFKCVQFVVCSLTILAMSL